MKKIKPIKPKLRRRITNAIKCLKGEPWPMPLTYELPKVERYNVQSFAAKHVTGRDFDEWAPENMGEIIQKEMAAELCNALLQAGAIEITTEPADPQEYDPWAGTVYCAKIRVVMPEKKEVQKR